jgi:hypothetical protein
VAPARPLRRLAVLALLLGSVLAAGCSGGESLPPEWKGRDLREPGWRNETVRAGWTLGFEYVWSSGRQVEWDWITEGRLMVYFQVQRMEGGQAQSLVAGHGDQGAQAITVPASGQYYILFRNEGAVDIPVWYNLPEGAIRRLFPPGEAPDCFFLAAAPAAC